MSRQQLTQRRRRSMRINPELAPKTAKQNWRTGLNAAMAVTGNNPDRHKNPSGLRIRGKDGSIKRDQKVNRFLKNFGDLGKYLDESNSYYKGWTGMKPIYEMDNEIDGIDYQQIFLNSGEDLIFSNWNNIVRNRSLKSEQFINELGRKTSKASSEGLRIPVSGGLRLRKDLMTASNSSKKPLIFVFATHAHVMLAVVYEGTIYSIGYAHVVEDNHIARGKIPAGVDASQLPNYVDPHTFEVIQGVLWSCDYVMPGTNHPVKVPWIDYLDHNMALRLNDYLSKVTHIEIDKQTIGGREVVSNQSQLFLDRALYLKSAAQLSPVFRNKDKALNCILWAGYIVGKDFSCGLLNDPKDCKSIPDKMMINLYEDQTREGNYYVKFNDHALREAHKYLQPTVPHKVYNTILRNPKTAAAVCGAGTAALCPGATGTVAAAAAKGAIAGTAIGACCQYTTGAVMGNMSTSNKSQDHAPQVLEMTRRGGKTRKRKYRKRNRLKTKKRNRKKTNKRKKRKTKSKRKFKKKTRKSK